MLAVAQERHPDFRDDCLSDPGMLRDHWTRPGHLHIDYVDNLDRVVDGDASTVVDDSEDLSGLFTLAIWPKRKSLIQVKHRNGEYTARRNFTLLHEIGHYLQQTDDELADALIGGFSARYEEKLFEEAACNRFASLALLPADYVLGHLGGGPVTAEAINDLFEYERNRRGARDIRVSRPVIARRMASFLHEGGTVTLIGGGSVTRAHQNGDVEYYEVDDPSGLLNETERLLYGEFSATTSKPHARCQLIREGDGSAAEVSIARSFGKVTYYFIVTEYVRDCPALRMNDAEAKRRMIRRR